MPVEISRQKHNERKNNKKKEGSRQKGIRLEVKHKQKIRIDNGKQDRHQNTTLPRFQNEATIERNKCNGHSRGNYIRP